jgi:hypothetical protein
LVSVGGVVDRESDDPGGEGGFAVYVAVLYLFTLMSYFMESRVYVCFSCYKLAYLVISPFFSIFRLSVSEVLRLAVWSIDIR